MALIVLFVVPQFCVAQSEPLAVRAWFTQSEVKFYVIDGPRVSEPVTVKTKVEK